MYTKCLLFACVLALANARSTVGSQSNAIPQEEARSSENSYMGDLRFLFKMYQECSSSDVSSCLKLKLVTAMDRASRMYKDISLTDGIVFVKDANVVESEPIKTEAEIEASLPRALSDREDTLNGLIFDKVFSFFQTHTLQVKLPSSDELQRSLSEVGEERGKKKKNMGGLLLIPLLLGGTLIPLAFGALALLAGKALIVSKLALVLAGIIGLKKLIASSHAHEGGHVEVVAGGGGGHGSGGWGRAYNAQDMAYRAHTPDTKQ